MRQILLALILLPVSLSAQTVYFYFTDGTMQSYAVADIRKLTYESDEQVLWLNNGTQYSWNVSTIGHYEFQEMTGVEHIASGYAPLPLQVYPNPSGGPVTVEVELVQSGRLVMEVLDLQGRIVRGLYTGERTTGPFLLQWDVTDDRGARVAPGTYMVRIRTPHASSTKPVVIQ